ncbi:hypothetical protein PHET_02027 [Paragonimus heterotremus]|uniref:Uncharacterized protein n=1 Tax=Paragonimus heterotremus TaxID=100268 RepID=A0A8J4T2Q7_9TREM|nr:hypothetical protein PHET_02027 [Paragonimus heterotremus]
MNANCMIAAEAKFGTTQPDPSYLDPMTYEFIRTYPAELLETLAEQKDTRLNDCDNILTDLKQALAEVPTLSGLFRQADGTESVDLESESAQLLLNSEQEFTKIRQTLSSTTDGLETIHTTLLARREQLQDQMTKRERIVEDLRQIERELCSGPPSDPKWDMLDRLIFQRSLPVVPTTVDQTEAPYKEHSCLEDVLSKMVAGQSEITSWWKAFLVKSEERLIDIKSTLAELPSEFTESHNLLEHVSNSLEKAKKFTSLQEEGLTSLIYLSTAWNKWKTWWTSCELSDIVIRGGPCNLLADLSLVDQNSRLTVDELQSLQARLERLAECGHDEGKQHLVNLTDAQHRLQTSTENIRSFYPVALIGQSISYLQRSPLTIGLTAAQMLIREADFHWAVVFDYLSLARERLQTRKTNVDVFLRKSTDVWKKVEQLERKIESMELTISVSKDVDTNVQWDQLSWEALQTQLPPWPNAVQSLIADALATRISLFNESKQLLEEIHSVAEKCLCLDRSAHALGLNDAQISTLVVSITTDQSIFLSDLNRRQTNLAKRSQALMLHAETGVQSHHRLTETWRSLADWAGQLQQNVSIYVNLSGDRHLLQARLELVKNLQTIGPLVETRLTDLKTLVCQYLTQHTLPLTEDCTRSTWQQLQAAFWLQSLDVQNRVTDAQRSIEIGIDKLSNAIQTWQMFDDVRERLEVAIRRLDHWFKTQSNDVVDTEQDLMQRVHLLQSIMAELDPANSEIQQQAIDVHTDPVVQLAREVHQNVIELRVSLRSIPQISIVSEPIGDTERSVEVCPSAADRVNELTDRIVHLKNLAHELIILWKVRLEKFSNWQESSHSFDGSLSDLHRRAVELQTKLSVSRAEPSSDSVQTIEYTFTMLEAIAEERSSLSHRLSELRGIASEIIPFVSETGRQGFQTKLNELRQYLEAVDPMIDQCRIDLTRRQNGWSKLNTHLTALDEWLTSSLMEFEQLIISTPWRPEVQSVQDVDSKQLNSHVEEQSVADKTDNRLGVSLVLTFNGRVAESFTFCERIRCFLESIQTEKSKLRQVMPILNELSGQVTSSLDAAVHETLTHVTERFERLEKRANLLYEQTKRYYEILDRFTLHYGDCWKQIMQLHSQFNHEQGRIIEQSVANRKGDALEPQTDVYVESLRKLAECLGPVEVMERLACGKDLGDTNNITPLTCQLASLFADASEVDNFDAASSDSLTQQVGYRAVEILLYYAIQLSKMTRRRLKRFLDENTLLEEVNHLFIDLESELFNADQCLQSILCFTDEAASESSECDTHWTWIQSAVCMCGKRESKLVSHLPASQQVREEKLNSIQLLVSRLEEGTGRAYLNICQHLASLKSKHSLLNNKAFQLQTQLRAEVNAWNEFSKCIQRYEDWISADEACADSILSGRSHGSDVIDDTNQQTCYENITHCLDALESLETSLTERGKPAREQLELAIHNLMLNMVPISNMSSTRTERRPSLVNMPFTERLSATMDALLRRWDEYRTKLQHIRSELCDELMSQTKLDSSLERLDRWIHSMSLQVEVLEQDSTSNLSELFLRLRVPSIGLDEDQLLTDLMAWFHPKMHTIETFQIEVHQFDETDMNYVNSLVDTHLSTEKLVRDRLKQMTKIKFPHPNSVDFPLTASERMSLLWNELRELESRLDKHSSNLSTLQTLCKSFIRLRFEIEQSVMSKRQTLYGLILEMENLTRPSVTEFQDPSSMQLITEKLEVKLHSLIKLKDESSRDADRYVSDITKAAQNMLSHACGFRQGLSTSFNSAAQIVVSVEQDVSQFRTTLSDVCTQISAWILHWSTFAANFDEMMNWLCSTESNIIHSIQTELEESCSEIFHYTNIEEIRHVLEQIQRRVSLGEELHKDLVQKRDNLENLIVVARTLVEKSLLPDQCCLQPMSLTTSVAVRPAAHFSMSGELAVVRATQMIQRYQTLLSLCDRRVQLNQTAFRTVEQVLAACDLYHSWSEELVSHLTLLTKLLAEPLNPRLEGDRHTVSGARLVEPIRSRAAELTNQLECGSSVVQNVCDWVNRMVSELSLQRRQRSVELAMLRCSSKNTLLQPDKIPVLIETESSQPEFTQPEKASIYCVSDYAALVEKVRTVCTQVDQTINKITNQNVAQQHILSWLGSTENQLITISQHASPSFIALSISQEFGEFEKSLEVVEHRTAEALETLKDLRLSFSEYRRKINRLESCQNLMRSSESLNIKERYSRLVSNLDNCCEDLNKRLNMLRLFQQSSEAFTVWLVELEIKADSLSGTDGVLITDSHVRQTEVLKSRDGMDLSGATDFSYARVTHLADAEQRLALTQQIEVAIQSRGQPLANRTTELGQQLIAHLRLAEELGDWDQSNSTMDSYNQLSVLIQDHVEGLNCRLNRLVEVQQTVSGRLRELAQVWNECFTHMDQLDEWIRTVHSMAHETFQQRLDSASVKHQMANSIESLYRECVDKQTEFELCMKRATGVRSLAPNCQLPEKVQQLTDRYHGAIDLVASTLSQLRQAGELHDQYDKSVTKMSEWLTSNTDRLPQCICTPDLVADRLEMERRLVAGRNLADVITQQAAMYLDPVVRLADQVVQTSDPSLHPVVFGQVDSFRQTIHETTQQLLQSQEQLETRLDRWNKWFHVQTEVSQFLEAFTRQLVHIATENTSRQELEDRISISCTRLISMEQSQLEDWKRLEEEIKNRHPLLEQLKRVTNELVILLPSATEQVKQTEKLETRFEKIQQEIKVRVTNSHTIWKKLADFGAQINEAETWILSISLKLMAVRSAEPDGPYDVIRLGRIHTELKRQIDSFRSISMVRLKQMANTCQTELNDSRQTEKAVEHLLQSAKAPASSDEDQAMSLVHVQANANSSIDGQSQSDNCRVTVFQTELTQLEASCDSLEDMCRQIKERLIDEQSRWARFVSVLGRVAAYVNKELPEWWSHRPQLPSRSGPPVIRSLRKSNWSSSQSRLSDSDDSAVAALQLSGAGLHKPRSKLLDVHEVGIQLNESDMANARLSLFIQELSQELNNIRVIRHTKSQPTLPATLMSMVKEKVDPATILSEMLDNCTKGELHTITESKVTESTLTGTELNRKAAELQNSLKLSAIKLKNYIDNLHDLRTKWEQQQLCEAEFDAWLKRKELEVREAINRPGRQRHHSSGHEMRGAYGKTYNQLSSAMDTARLESLRLELKDNGPLFDRLLVEHAQLEGRSEVGIIPELEAYGKRLDALLTRVDNALAARRAITAQAMEATALTDHLHRDLHHVVRQSAGLDITDCTTHLRGLKTRRGLGGPSGTDKERSVKQPIFWASSLNLSKHPNVTVQASQQPKRPKTHHSSAVLSTARSTPNLGAEQRVNTYDLSANALDWLWYSPSTVLGFSPNVNSTELLSGHSLDFSLTRIADDPQHPPEGQQTAPISRSSSKSSLLFSRPWTSYRSLERSNKKSWPDWRSHMKTSMQVPLAEPKSMFFSNLGDVDRHRVGPITVKQIGHSIKAGGSHPGTSSIGIQSDISPPVTSLPMSDSPVVWTDDSRTFPLLLRRSVSPVPTKTRKPSGWLNKAWSGTFYTLRQGEQTRNTAMSSSPLSTEFAHLAPRQSQPTTSLSVQTSQSTVKPDPSRVSIETVKRPSAPSLRSSEFWTSPTSDLDAAICAGRPQPMGASISDSIVTSAGQMPTAFLIHRRAADNQGVSECTEEIQRFTGTTSTVSNEATSTTASVTDTTARFQILRRAQTPAAIALQRYRHQQRQLEEGSNKPS